MLYGKGLTRKKQSEGGGGGGGADEAASLWRVRLDGSRPCARQNVSPREKKILGSGTSQLEGTKRTTTLRRKIHGVRGENSRTPFKGIDGEKLMGVVSSQSGRNRGPTLSKGRSCRGR